MSAEDRRRLATECGLPPRTFPNVDATIAQYAKQLGRLHSSIYHPRNTTREAYRQAIRTLERCTSTSGRVLAREWELPSSPTDRFLTSNERPDGNWNVQIAANSKENYIRNFLQNPESRQYIEMRPHAFVEFMTMLTNNGKFASHPVVARWLLDYPDLGANILRNRCRGRVKSCVRWASGQVRINGNPTNEIFNPYVLKGCPPYVFHEDQECRAWCQNNSCDAAIIDFCRNEKDRGRERAICACINSPISGSPYNPLCVDRKCIDGGHATQSMITALGNGCQVVDCRVLQNIEGGRDVDIADSNITLNCGQQPPPVMRDNDDIPSDDMEPVPVSDDSLVLLLVVIAVFIVSLMLGVGAWVYFSGVLGGGDAPSLGMSTEQVL